MRVELHLGGGADGAALLDLFGWLSQTRPVTRGAELALRSAHGSGAMSVGDAIVVSASAVSSLSAIVQAYAAWRSTRQASPTLVVSLQDGNVIHVARGSADEAAALVRAVSGSASAEAAPAIVEEQP